MQRVQALRLAKGSFVAALVGLAVASPGVPESTAVRAQGVAAKGVTHDRLTDKSTPTQRAGRPVRVLRSISDAIILDSDVRGVDGDALVHAKARVRDLRPGRRYLWTLDVTDLVSKKTVDRIVYGDQAFDVVNEPGPIEVAFSEVLPLEQGRYRVQLRLLNVPAEIDFRVLYDDAIADEHKSLSCVETIEL